MLLVWKIGRNATDGRLEDAQLLTLKERRERRDLITVHKPVNEMARVDNWAASIDVTSDVLTVTLSPPRK